MPEFVSISTAAKEFLNLKNIAVAGVSSVNKDAANGIYTSLRERGYRVFALNPKVATVEDDPCYPDISSIPEKVDGLVIVTKPEVTTQLVKDAHKAGIKHVWIHKSMGDSVSQEAVEFGKANGMKVIPGGCPMMFIEGADFGHRCMKSLLILFGRIPNEI